MGLCFSVNKGIKIPSSLLNMYKELKSDLNCRIPTHGDLSKWQSQGIMMLNTSLTVRAHNANSHSKKGWEQFTDKAIEKLVKVRKNIVFLLWGKNAQEKEKLIKNERKWTLGVEIGASLGIISAQRVFWEQTLFSNQRIFEEKLDWTNRLANRIRNVSINMEIHTFFSCNIYIYMCVCVCDYSWY